LTLKPTCNTSLAGILVLLTLLVIGCSGNREPVARNFNLSIVNRTVGAEHNKLRVTQDDQVTLHITTDEDGTLHIHGYDLESIIKTGQTSEIQFKANATGKFAFEMHVDSEDHKQGEHQHNHDTADKGVSHEFENADIILGFLEVLPK
jgi:hypothetical protein